MKTTNNTKNSTKNITTVIPVNKEYVGLARLLASGLAAKMHFTYKEIQSLKGAVSRACLKCIKEAPKKNMADNKIKLTYIQDSSSLTIIIKDKTGFAKTINKSHSFSSAFLREYLVQSEAMQESVSRTKVHH